MMVSGTSTLSSGILYNGIPVGMVSPMLGDINVPFWMIVFTKAGIY